MKSRVNCEEQCDEAIQKAGKGLDCFASLATTAPTARASSQRSGIYQTYTALINGLGQSPPVKLCATISELSCAPKQSKDAPTLFRKPEIQCGRRSIPGSSSATPAVPKGGAWTCRTCEK